MRGIEGFFSEDEGRWYARFARGLRGGIFVEVGSWKGRSTSFIAPVCKANGTRLVCVDHYAGSRDALNERYEAALRVEDVAATFRANMTALGALPELLVLSSLDAARRFEDGSVDRLFLDGSHDGPSVAEDLAAWRPKLAASGIIAGHDYAPAHVGLRAAVDAFAVETGMRVHRGPRSVFWLEQRH